MKFSVLRKLFRYEGVCDADQAASSAQANDDARYVCSVARRSTQIEFAIPNALLQEAS